MKISRLSKMTLDVECGYAESAYAECHSFKIIDTSIMLLDV
jgi:hypothetical protein